MIDPSVITPAVRRQIAPQLVGRDLERMEQADLVLLLLSNGSREALGLVESLVGKPIQKELPSMPPRLPARVAPVSRLPRVQKLESNPFRPGTAAWRRFGRVKVGMSVDDLRNKGVTARDQLRWSRKGLLTVSP